MRGLRKNGRRNTPIFRGGQKSTSALQKENDESFHRAECSIFRLGFQQIESLSIQNLSKGLIERKGKMF